MSEETQGTPDQTTEAQTNVVAPPAEESSKVHPGWDRMLAELPEAWHSKVEPYLIENDKNVQSQLERYTPFKEYLDQGVSPEVILGGINLARAIESQPTEVYQSLQDYLVGQGLLETEAKQAAQNIMEEESGEDFEDIFDEDNVPAALRKELQALRNQQEEQSNYIQQQELDKATNEYTIELESEMDLLRSEYNISDAHEIAIYDLMNAALNANREISVADAAKQLQAMVGGFNKVGEVQSESAPMVIGSAGGAGVQVQNLNIPKDDKGKKAMLEQMFKDYQKANQSGI